jgi:hypothetical protein
LPDIVNANSEEALGYKSKGKGSESKGKWKRFWVPGSTFRVESER